MNLDDGRIRRMDGGFLDEMILYCTKACLQSNSKVPLMEHVIGLSLLNEYDQSNIHNRFQFRGFQVLPTMSSNNDSDTHNEDAYLCDVGILEEKSSSDDDDDDNKCNKNDERRKKEDDCHSIRRGLVQGGLLLLIGKKDGITNIDEWKSQKEDEEGLCKDAWDVEHAELVVLTSFYHVVSVRKRPCCINRLSCPWKPLTQQKRKDDKESSLDYERRILAEATVSLSVSKQRMNAKTTTTTTAVMNKDSIEKAVNALKVHGFVVVKSLLDSQRSKHWGQAALTDFDSAIQIIQDRYHIDLLQPNTDHQRKSFQQMAMREDLRVDIHDGPQIQQLRQMENPIDYTHCQIIIPNNHHNDDEKNKRRMSNPSLRIPMDSIV